jgi:hypothetical protein
MGGCCKCSVHCKGGYENCENTTGICLDGCEPGYYGAKCVDKCSSHCAGNGTVCNSTTGECPSGCQNDWYLSTCKYGCSFLTITFVHVLIRCLYFQKEKSVFADLE